MNYIFNSRKTEFKNPFGPCKEQDVLEFNIKAKDGVFISNMFFVLQKDQEDKVYYKMEYSSKKDGFSIFTLKIKIESSGLYFYHFEVETENGVEKIYRDDFSNATLDGDRLFQLTVTKKDYKTPNFIKGGIIYHIFVDRFFSKNPITKKDNAVFKNWNEILTIKDKDGVRRANDFYLGNFEGIIDKLDYLKELNVTLLYLSPIFLSPSNHRYDTSDYLKIDDLLGDENIFKELINQCKKRNISIMLDGVFNHTGADSIYFNKFSNFNSIGAFQSKNSEYFDWFDFINFPQEYRCWWGVTICPSVNQQNEEYRKFITKQVIPKWLSFGVKGYRLDVVDELQPYFVKEIRKAVKENDENNILIGEVWEDASNKISYSQRRSYFQGESLDGVMNYVFKDAILAYVKTNNKYYFEKTVLDIVENYPKQSLDVSMTLIGTHDTTRIINQLLDIDTYHLSDQEKINFKLDYNQKQKAINMLKMTSFLQFTLPGVPSIYYGDEIGMEGLEDPLNRAPFDWEQVGNEINMHYLKLAKIRQDNKETYSGFFDIINCNDLLIYKRFNDKKEILHIVNNNDYDVKIPFKIEKNNLFNAIYIKDNNQYIRANSFDAIIY